MPINIKPKDSLVKKVGEKSLSKKNLIIIVTIIAVLGGGTYAVNSYLEGKHQQFLKDYAKAIADINSKNKTGYKKAYEILEELSKDDKTTALDKYYLGYMYQYGLGTNINYTKAYRNYRDSIESSNNNKALYQMAILYTNGNGVNKDYPKALDYLVKAYENGYRPALEAFLGIFELDNDLILTTDPKVLYKIGTAYEKHAVEPSGDLDSEAFFNGAAAQGYEPALIKVANIAMNNGNNKKAAGIWRGLLKSKDPETVKIAKTNLEIIKAKQEELRTRKLLEQESQLEQSASSINEAINDIKQSDINNELEEKPQEKVTTTVRPDNVVLDALESKNALTHDEKYTGLISLHYYDIDTKYLSKGLKKAIENNSVQASPTNKYYNTISKSQYIESLFAKQEDNDLFSQIWQEILQNKETSNTTSSLINISDIYNKNVSYANKLLEILELYNFDNTGEPYYAINFNYQDLADVSEHITIIPEHEMLLLKEQAELGNSESKFKLEQEALNNNKYALYYLGEYYADNEDNEKAVKYYKKSAKLKYGKAYYKIATMYFDEENDGLDYDKEKAIKYYKLAAANGVKNAQYILMLLQ